MWKTVEFLCLKCFLGFAFQLVRRGSSDVMTVSSNPPCVLVTPTRWKSFAWVIGVSIFLVFFWSVSAVLGENCSGFPRNERGSTCDRLQIAHAKDFHLVTQLERLR